MDIREATSYLLRAHDVGRWIQLADGYIKMYNKMPSAFVLPKEHEVLKPVIESFAANTNAFADYIKALRDGSTGLAYDELHDMYRTVSVRALQVDRRTRIRKAVLLLLPDIEHELCREVSYDEQMEIAKFVEQDWGARRMAILERERRQMKNHRLNSEERAAVLDAYWKDIDNKLGRGAVPLSDNVLPTIIEKLRWQKN